MRKDSEIADALAEYQRGALTTKDIAAKHGVSQSTLTVWATNAGLKLRTRGRRKLDEPTTKQKEILKMAEVHTYERVGEHFGVKKQAIHRVVKHWRNWMQPKRSMFEAGDVLLWRGQRLTVLAAGLHSGVVMGAGGRTMRSFPWNHKGTLPKKIGVNRKIATAA